MPEFFYERHPYPNIPLVAKVFRDQLWQLNLDWLFLQAQQKLPGPKPKIWIAGCGTFQPYILATANPHAEIIASDFSRHSLKIAQKRIRYHNIKNVKFHWLDLTDPQTYPTEKFDFIESYGVLMNFDQPAQVLKNIADRLKDNGLMRLMVYPYFSRQRIFQIRHLAKLFGLVFDQKKAPQKLKKIILGLPKDHPLRFTFINYADMKTEGGIADGFLNPNDQGFHAYQLASFFNEADLKFKLALHRPWGQPQNVALAWQKISPQTKEFSAYFWLYYLDLWQELRTQFILVLAKQKAASQKQKLKAHPLFNLKNPNLSLRDKLRLMRLGVTGTYLDSRIDADSLKVSAKKMRSIFFKKETLENPLIKDYQLSLTQQELKKHPVEKKIQPLFKQQSVIQINSNQIINPIYNVLCEAYCFADALKKESHFGDSFLNSTLKKHLDFWKTKASPLENPDQPFGLTPFGSWPQFKKFWPDDGYQIKEENNPLPLKNWSLKKQQVLDWLKKQTLPTNLSERELNWIWLIIFGYQKPVL